MAVKIFLRKDLFSSPTISFGPIYARQVGDKITVNWGDTFSSTVTYSGSGVYFDHTYLLPIFEFQITITGISKFGPDCFRNNRLIYSLEIEDSITAIDQRAFYNCNRLTIINIQGQVSTIGSEAFAYCDSLSEINIQHNPNIDQKAFYNSPIKSAIISGACANVLPRFSIQNVTLLGGVFNYYIPAQGFMDCISLKEVTFNSSIFWIGPQAFENCTSLQKINFTGTISNWCNISFSNPTANPIYYAKKLYINDELITDINISNNQIKSYTFYNCASLTNVTLSDTLSTVGNNSFYGCSSLTEIVIPENVLTIGYEAFENCTSLQKIIVKPLTPPNLGDDAFDDTNDCLIQVYNQVASSYKAKWVKYSSRINRFALLPPMRLIDYTKGSFDYKTRDFIYNLYRFANIPDFTGYIDKDVEALILKDSKEDNH